uniref:SGF29 C-terminal domain-containing protein n=1 Tax=Trichuris muris TaxID=70415 RepID=A0A5S6QRC1_TRIMR
MTSQSVACNSLSTELVQAFNQLKQEIDVCFDRFAKDGTQLEELKAFYEKLDREENRPSNYNRSKLKTSVQSFLKNCELQFASAKQVLNEVQSAQRVLEAKKAEVMLTKQRGASNTRRSTDKQNGVLRRCTLMFMLQKSAISIPLWVSISNDSAPPLCGSVPAAPDYVCSLGDLCVAKVKADDYWILAEVKAYYSAQAKYTVEDIDEEQKERHILGRKKIIPLPIFRAHPALNPEALFEVNSAVLALYPQTTCFYRGIVQRRPPGPLDSYLVAFEDSSYPTGFSPPLTVPQRYVVSQ